MQGIISQPQTDLNETVKPQHAQVHFNEQGTPVADHFDDVYFSNDSGIHETRHVFIDGNDLPHRWLNHTRRDFIIAETGFGTGLNCLVVMDAFKQFRQQNPTHPLKRLYVLSTEKFPLGKRDLQQALTAFSELTEPASMLLAKYPIAIEGCHRLHFDAYATTLDLWIGDVHTVLPQWHVPEHGLVDAWFLDGFAPSKNPDMWTDALFSQMGRVSRQGCTLGTFTAAGVVKRGLQNAGFAIQKRKGFGRKRDMLSGRYEGEVSPLNAPPYARFTGDPVNEHHRVGIIGGGMAAAMTARALAKHGVASTLLCADSELAAGASGNPRGGFYPQLHSEASHASMLQAHGFTYARRYYDEVSAPFDHQWCGVLQLCFNDKVRVRQEKLIANDIWPTSLICALDRETTNALAGLPIDTQSLYIPLGGWISPPQLVQALVREAEHFTEVRYNTRVTGITEVENGVRVSTEEYEDTFDYVVIATGAGSVHMNALDCLPMRPVRGQVEAIPASLESIKLKAVLCHKGYMTPAEAERHALGSTYTKNDLGCDVRVEDTQTNLATHYRALPQASWLKTLSNDGTARGSVRLALPDHQPAVGQVLPVSALTRRYKGLASGKPLSSQPTIPPSKVFTLTGLGSRGLTTAPLMAEVLAAQLTHTPLPLSETLLQAVSPIRFAIRACIRGEALRADLDGDG